MTARETSGLTLPELAQAKGLPIEFLKGLGLRDERYFGRAAVAIPYRDAGGQLVRLRYRVALEGDRFRWRKGDRADRLYGLDRLVETNTPASLFLVEGESDCWTLWRADFPAVGVPGASTFSAAMADELIQTGIPLVYVIDEGDAGGRTLLDAVARSSIAARVMVVDLPGAKDPSALYLADPDRFYERLRDASANATALPEPAAGLGADPDTPARSQQAGEPFHPEGGAITAAPLPGPNQEPAALEMAWPDPIDKAAYHGLAGEIVHRIEPTTEADPIALLFHLLTFFGNAAGLRPHVMVEDTEHGANEYVAIVGATSKSRKGTAERRIRRAFDTVDPVWVGRIKTGLSSGEGLIWQMRDRIEKDGKVEDEGEPDKRLLALESELATTLRRIEREGSSLSPILRDAWDRRPLDALVSERSRAAARAGTNHVSVVGHITRSELARYMARTEMANGFGNRFLWGLVRRARYLPRGSRPPGMADLTAKLHKALEHAKGADELDLDRDALRIWDAVYPTLSDAKPGLAGEMVARGEAHVLRLGLIYALLDGDTAIRPAHLLAALAVWTYCEESVLCIFGAELGDPDADAVLGQLQGVSRGLTTSELHAAFDRHWEAARLARVLKTLIEHGAVTEEKETTKSRPATRYRALAGLRPRRPAYLDLARNAIGECELCELCEGSPNPPSLSTNEPPAALRGIAKNLNGGPAAPEIVRRFFADSSQSETGELIGAGPDSSHSSHNSQNALVSDDGADATP